MQLYHLAPQHTSSDYQHQHNSASVPAVAGHTSVRIPLLHLYKSCQLIAHLACMHIHLQPKRHLFAFAELLGDHRSLAWLQAMPAARLLHSDCLLSKLCNGANAIC